jgi:hypothetical protein
LFLHIPIEKKATVLVIVAIKIIYFIHKCNVIMCPLVHVV